MRTCCFLLALSILFLTLKNVKCQYDSSSLWFKEYPDTIITFNNVKINKSLFVKDSIMVDKMIVKKLLRVGDKGTVFFDMTVVPNVGEVDRMRATTDRLIIFGNYDDVTVSPIKVGIGTYTPLNYGDPENNVGLKVNGQINLTDAMWCPDNSTSPKDTRINAYHIRGVPVLSVQKQLTPRNIFSFNFIYPILTI